MNRKNKQIFQIILTGIIMAVGLILLKWIPMEIYGRNILSDASMHITIACFILYIIYFFIDQNKSWRIPYLLFAFMVLIIISVQRIFANAHNDVGLLGGFLISIIAILLPRWGELKKYFKF